MYKYIIIYFLFLNTLFSQGTPLLPPLPKDWDDTKMNTWEEEPNNGINLGLDEPQIYHYKLNKENTIYKGDSSFKELKSFKTITVNSTTITVSSLDDTKKSIIFKIKDQKDLLFKEENEKFSLPALIGTSQDDDYTTLILTPNSIEIIKFYFNKSKTIQTWGRRIDSKLIPKIMELKEKIKIIEASSERGVIIKKNNKALFKQ